MSGQALSASIAFPRFVADLDPALDRQMATLRSTVVWEPRAAWSLMAVVPGRARSQEAVLLTAGYEANGAIDGLNPGATRAWGAAALTEIACDSNAPEPARTVVPSTEISAKLAFERRMTAPVTPSSRTSRFEPLPRTKVPASA